MDEEGRKKEDWGGGLEEAGDTNISRGGGQGKGKGTEYEEIKSVFYPLLSI